MTSTVTIIAGLVAIVIAWKLLKGVVKIGVMLGIIVLVGYLATRGMI